jgi:hypothetical protein
MLAASEFLTAKTQLKYTSVDQLHVHFLISTTCLVPPPQVLGNGTLYGGNASFAALYNGSYYMPGYNLVYELFLAPNDTSALANITFANSTAEDNFVNSVVPMPISCGAAVVYTVRANGEAVSAVLSCDGTIGEY